MKLNGYLLLVGLCIIHEQFAMEDNKSIKVHQLENAYNTFKQALEQNELSLLQSPIACFREIQEKMPLPDDIKNVMAQHPSPLIYILKKIQTYDTKRSELEAISKELMWGCDISDRISECQQLRNRHYQLLTFLCSQAPFLCSSLWSSTHETPLLCAVSCVKPMEDEIRLLLYYNANPYQHVSNSEKYKNPLEAATALGYTSIVDLLIAPQKLKGNVASEPVKRANIFIAGPSKKKLQQKHNKLLDIIKFNDAKSFKQKVDKNYIDINHVYDDEKNGPKYLLAYLLDNYFAQREIFFMIGKNTNEGQLTSSSTVKKVDSDLDAAADMLFYFINKKPNLDIDYIYNQTHKKIEDQKYETPLKEAIKYGAWQLIFELLKAGADHSFKNNDTDTTPLEYAYEKSQELGLYIETLLK